MKYTCHRDFKCQPCNVNKLVSQSRKSVYWNQNKVQNTEFVKMTLLKCIKGSGTHNRANNQWKRNPCKQNSERTFSNKFLTNVSKTSQATMDSGKNESKDEHYHLQTFQGSNLVMKSYYIQSKDAKLSQDKAINTISRTLSTTIFHIQSLQLSNLILSNLNAIQLLTSVYLFMKNFQQIKL